MAKKTRKWLKDGLCLILVLSWIGGNPARGSSYAPSTSASKVSPITFEEVHRQFSPDAGLTELQKDHAWERYKGKCIEWTGELVSMDEGFLGGINIGFRHREETFTFDVLVRAPESMKDVLLELRKGKRYTYKATLDTYPGAIMPVTADYGCKD